MSKAKSIVVRVTRSTKATLNKLKKEWGYHNLNEVIVSLLPKEKRLPKPFVDFWIHKDMINYPEVKEKKGDK